MSTSTCQCKSRKCKSTSKVADAAKVAAAPAPAASAPAAPGFRRVAIPEGWELVPPGTVITATHRFFLGNKGWTGAEDLAGRKADGLPFPVIRGIPPPKVTTRIYGEMIDVDIPEGFEAVPPGGGAVTQAGDLTYWCVDGFKPIAQDEIGLEVKVFYCVARAKPIKAEPTEEAGAGGLYVEVKDRSAK